MEFSAAPATTMGVDPKGLEVDSFEATVVPTNTGDPVVSASATHDMGGHPRDTPSLPFCAWLAISPDPRPSFPPRRCTTVG